MLLFASIVKNQPMEQTTEKIICSCDYSSVELQRRFKAPVYSI